MFCNVLNQCKLPKCGLCDKPCELPCKFPRLCEKPCPCVKKINAVRDDLNSLKGDVQRNKQQIKINYDLLSEAINNLAELHSKDYNYTINYINEKDAENDYLLEQEIIRAKAAELDIDDRLAKEIANRIEDVDNEEERATLAEHALDDKIDQEIQDRIADVNAEEDRAKGVEGDLQLLITNNYISLGQRLDDALGIDAAGLVELKAILSDNDTATGIIVELAKKADKSGVTAGTYKSVTVNSDGIVTAGTNPTTIAGYGITDAYTKTETDGLLDTKADKNNTTAGTYTKVTVNNQGIVTAGSNPTTLEGYQISDANITNGQSGGKVITLGNNDVTVYTKSESDTLLVDKADKVSMTPGTYKSVTVNGQGIVTAGTNPTTISGYGITDAKIENGTITLGSNTITPLTQHLDISGKADKSNITAGDYTKVTVNSDGIVTAGTNPTTISGYGITDAKIENGANDIGKKITLGNQNVTVYTKSEVDTLISNLTNQISTLLGYWSVSNDGRLTTSYVIEPEGYK